MALRLNTIICSTRPGRVGPKVAHWFHDFAVAHGKFDAALVDLADFELPIFDEPKHPRLAQYEHAHTKRWAESVASADAFVFVTPEYNHSVPGGFKNAFDSLGNEWGDKPVGFVSDGAESGVRAVEHWRQIVANFRMFGVRQQVSCASFSEFPDGDFSPNDRRAGELNTLLDQLIGATTKLAR